MFEQAGVVACCLTMKWLTLLMAAPLFGACTGSSPSWTTTPDQASFTTCWNNAASQSVAQTINVSSGSAAWSSAWAGNIATPSITIQGATSCTGSGDPYGSTSGVVSCTDNTTITINSGGQFAPNGCLIRITGLTFVGGADNSNGMIQMGGTYGSVCARFDHNHIESVYEVPLYIWATFGLIDHNLIQDTNTSGSGPQLLGVDGSVGTNGYLDWQNPTNLGSNLAVVIEQNEITSTSPTPYQAYDTHYGTTVAMRFNTVSRVGLALSHGTDSGGARSGLVNEVYENTDTNPPSSAQEFIAFRGGTALVWGNAISGSPWNGIELVYNRYSGQSNSTTWGLATAGLNWTPISANDTQIGSFVMTLNAPDWQANHSYTCSPSVPCMIGPLLNNKGTGGAGVGGYNYIATVSGTSGSTEPNPWNQTFGCTVASPTGCTQSDGTMTWLNIGGGTTAVPAPGAAAGFLSSAPDTPCSSGATCTYHLDSLGGSAGTYPFRDQEGRGHNQALMPDYEWLNTGASLPSPLFQPYGNLSGVVNANRDYYDYTSSFNGTSGVGSGTLASRPSTCTTGVAYWATDQGSWNVSSNGTGNGVLYQCSATNTWTIYYTPYTYPHPLEQGTQGSGPPTTPAPPTDVTATAK